MISDNIKLTIAEEDNVFLVELKNGNKLFISSVSEIYDMYGQDGILYIKNSILNKINAGISNQEVLSYLNGIVKFCNTII